MLSPGSRRWLRRGLVAVAGLLLALGVAVAVLLLHAPGNVSHPDVEFTQPTQSTTTTAPKRRVVVNDFSWPFYGNDAARSRFFPDGRKLNPPFRVGWKFNDYALLEFPPVIYQNTLYLIDDDGSAKAINKLNGHLLWQHRLGTLAAASPAIDAQHGLVFIPVLSTTPHASGPENGRLYALSTKTGRVAWSDAIPAGTESSPLVHGQSVFLGDQGGSVWSIRSHDGHVNWTYHASGAVKDGIAFANGMLYFGDYAGRAYALNPNNGREIWAVSTDGAHFGFGSGNFYSTPAAAFGRIYMGNTDGRVYSFAARTGQLAWASGTGAYVYASPAVADVAGLGPTVYIGSYDSTFYAFDARSGAVRWTHRAAGRISGSATIVGHVVYYSNLGSKTTTGLDLRTGRPVFSFPDGAFNALICDDGAIYLIGYSTIYQMLPQRADPAAVKKSARRAGTPAGRTPSRARHT